MPETSSNETWVLGVTLGLLGSIAINTGNNIQSLGLKSLKAEKKRQSKCTIDGTAPTVFPVDEHGNSTEKQELGHDRRKEPGGPCSSTVWIVGTVVFISGSLLNFASYGLAPQSMLASLESVQFVTNLIFGKFMLKAHVTRRMVVGTIFTVAGTVVAVQFSSKTTLTLTTAEMKQLYKNPAYISYLVLSMVIIALLNFVFNLFKRRQRDGIPLPQTHIVMPICYSVVSALVGTQSVVQAKVLAELLAVQSSGKENVFKSSFVYWTILVWLMTVIVWLSRLNSALSKFDPLFIIPLLQCSFIFFAIVSGGIFFREFEEFTKSQRIGFTLGVFVMFSGLSLLFPRRNLARVDIEVSSEMLEAGNGMSLNALVNLGEGSQKQDHENATTSSAPDIVMSNSFSSIGGNTTCEDPKVSPDSESSCNSKRHSRQSVTQAAVAAMKDAIVESANRSSLLMTPPTGIAYQQMVSEEKILERSNKLRRLQALLEETQTNNETFSPETLRLLNESAASKSFKHLDKNPEFGTQSPSPSPTKKINFDEESAG